MEIKKISHFSILSGTFLTLIVLSLIAIVCGRIDFENYNEALLPLVVDLTYLNDIIVVALAVIQTVLIVAVYMGLGYKRHVYTVVLAVGALLLFILLVLVLSDTLFRGEVDKAEALRPEPAEKVVAP
jgi:hypothetical protein